MRRQLPLKCEYCGEMVEFRVGCQYCGRFIGVCCEASLPEDDERSTEPLCKECL